MSKDWSVTALDAIDAEEAARVVERVQNLSELTRQVVTLRKGYGKSLDEIAAQLGITPAQVMEEIGRAVLACADLGEVEGA